jgi:hypothetical protein
MLIVRWIGPVSCVLAGPSNTVNSPEMTLI